MNHYLTVLKKYAVFSGRAQRAEYWYFFLFNTVISLVIGIVFGNLFGKNVADLIALLYALAFLLPGIGVTIRRLHDTGRTGWWCLIGLVPFIGVIILLVLLALKGQVGPNKYGEDPKGV
ncbi:MAG: DUF805 domain-containing protein [Patescibacteria group bacterium]|mgnify:CR=1 FL=1